MRVLKSRHVDVLVTDEQMPRMSGSQLLTWVTANFPDVARIMLTGHATMATAIRAINEGAVYQFFTKPCDDVQLAIAIRKALEHAALARENRRLLAIVREAGLDGVCRPAADSDGDDAPSPTCRTE